MQVLSVSLVSAFQEEFILSWVFKMDKYSHIHLQTEQGKQIFQANLWPGMGTTSR